MTQPENHDDLKIGLLPELRILPIEEIIFHEEPDRERVARLVERFGVDGVLKNPPVVGWRDGTSKRVLLDGANRITALRKLDLPHVLVQMIDYRDPGLVLDRWHHAIEHLSRQQLLDHAAALPGASIQSEQACPLSTPPAVARLRFTTGEAVVLSGSLTLEDRVGQLRQFMRIYQRHATMDRVSYTDMEHLRQNYRSFTALVSFPRLSKQDLTALTAAGVLLPSGITRVLLPKRALRFNLHLDILRSRLSLQEKNLWLADTIQQKIIEKAIRFYREPTFFFDE
jgi:hypothetical protein